MFHTIIIVGNLGQDPEMRYTPSGVPVTSFSVASSRQYNNSQGQLTKETIWFRVTCWNHLAETTNSNLKKGSKVLVEGRLTPDPATGRPRMWTRSDGTTSASYEVNASTVRFLSSKSDVVGGGANAQASGAAAGQSAPYTDILGEDLDEDEIPF